MPRHKKGYNPTLPLHLRELSYEVHTNRELEFMLKGIKPLAWFSDLIFDDHDMWDPDPEFEQQVQSGTFVKHEVRELWEPYTLNGHHVKGRWTRFYALKDEAWRIPAFMLLKKATAQYPWSDALERLEGSLLGYTDEQNDEWLANRRSKHAGWQCVTLYATTTSQALNEIADFGNRAFPKGHLHSMQLFTAESVPVRSTLERAGLLRADSYYKLIRFGVHQHFVRDCLEFSPSTGIAAVSIRPNVEARDINKALQTDIQILEVA